MQRSPLSLLLLAGLLAAAPAPGAAAQTILPPNHSVDGSPELDFASLVPSADAFAAAEDPGELLRDTLARIAVEARLRDRSADALDAELAALRGFLLQSKGVPEVSALEAFWAQHNATRAALGRPAIDVADASTLEGIAQRLGVPAAWLAPVVEETELVEPAPPSAAPTEDEARAYVAAHFPPVSMGIRQLVWASIGEGTERIESLGIRAAGALAELVLRDLDNPFVSVQGVTPRDPAVIPAADPLLALAEIDPDGAARLVTDHLGRGGLGWTNRILSLIERPTAWSQTPKDVATLEPWMARVVREPQLRDRLGDRIGWFYSWSFAGKTSLGDAGLLTAALLELPVGHELARAALRSATTHVSIRPPIADLARRVASDPTYAEPYAIRLASDYPGAGWVLGHAESEHPEVRHQVLQALGSESVLADTSLEQRTAAAEAILLANGTADARPAFAALEQGWVRLTVPMIEPVAASLKPGFGPLRFSAPLPSDDPLGVLDEALRLLPEEGAPSGWRGLLQEAWIVEVLRRPEGLQRLRGYLTTRDREARDKLAEALGYPASDVLFTALQGAGREALRLELLRVATPSPALPTALLEELLSDAAAAGYPNARAVLQTLTADGRAEPWDALGFAADASRPIVARVLALSSGLQASSGTLDEDKLRLVREILLHPAVDAALSGQELAVGAELGRLLVLLAGGAGHPLADPQFARAVSPAVIDALIFEGSLPAELTASLLDRLAAGPPLFEQRQKVWKALQGRRLSEDDRRNLLEVLEHASASDEFPILNLLASQGDPTLLPRFEAILTDSGAAQGGSGWSPGARLEAIRGLGRIGTVEAAQALRDLLRAGQLTAGESDEARTQLGRIAERIEQDRFWQSLESGVPGRDEATAQLVEQLASDSAPTRAAAARALGAIGATTLQPALIERLADPDAAVRAAAAEALELIALHVRRELQGDE